MTEPHEHEADMKLVRRYLEDFLNGRQLDLADELMTEDCIYLTPANTYYSREDIVTYKQILFESWSGFRVDIRDMKHDGDSVAADVIFEATPVKPFLGIPPTYKNFSMPAVGTFKIKDGKIRSVKIAYDFTKMLNREV